MSASHRLLVWCATQLQVDAPERWRSWLWRLFVLPPAGRSALPVDAQRVPDPLLWAAQALGVAPQAPWQQWLLRLWLLPPPSALPWARQAVHVRAAGRLFGALLQWLWPLLQAALVWPLQGLSRLLEGLAADIDLTALMARTDRAIAAVVRVPGLPWLLFLVSAFCAIEVLTAPLSEFGQFVFMALCWGSSMVLRKLPGRYPGLGLAAISLIALGRYVWWRVTTTLDFESLTEAALGCGLLAAEAYTWLVVLLGFVQTAWPLNRKSEPMEGDRTHWPTVDVLIPTYNEPMSVVRPTVLAALAMDWPADKLRVHILDDGHRPAFREFALSVGANYIERPNNFHAKAGNLNHALQQTDGELVVVFDCDHVPTREFLTTCAGWFDRDPKCAMVQTPHHFFSPDPFERNLGTFRRVPNEGSLFYGLIQDGNDFWNATFFCGSCAVLRREPLMQIGGIAVETVTEDAHTALRLHRLGYTTAYINKPLAAGLATESLAAHVGQRIRWARGMAQIFRIDNPMLGPGLSIWQRICYANAMLHFFFGLPRLVFLTAPMTYLFFGLHIIHANAMLLALYVLPYIVQSNIANAHIQGEHRHTFWAEVYETVLAVYVMLPTTLAMVNPKAGSFNVTAKGGLVARSYFDWNISAPYAILVVLNAAALVAGLLRLFVFNVNDSSTVVLNLVWTGFSMLLLGASLGVASESRQVRSAHRVAASMPAALYLGNGQVFHCRCIDYSMSGLGLRIPTQLQLPRDTRVHVSLWAEGTEYVFPARVLVGQKGLAGLQYEELTHAQELALVQCTFARPNAWVNWKESHDEDKPLQGLSEIGRLGLEGYLKLRQHVFDRWSDYRRRWQNPKATTA